MLGDDWDSRLEGAQDDARGLGMEGPRSMAPINGLSVVRKMAGGVLSPREPRSGGLRDPGSSLGNVAWIEW